MINYINNAEEFKNTISGSLTLIVFSADWCGPCRMLAPTLKNFAEKNISKIKIAKIKVDENLDCVEISKQYNVRGIPALYWFENGKVKHKETGLITEANLENITNQILSK